ncbi:MAG: hypothetical protein JSS96_04410 [Bacteroidetes bacterium]|nr:hypothetical protein [Bacteroidota bacterium]
MNAKHTHDELHRRHGRMPLPKLLRLIAYLLAGWGFIFWMMDKYGEWGKVMLETIVATGITIIIVLIIRNIYYNNRRRGRSKRHSLFMLLRK